MQICFGSLPPITIVSVLSTSLYNVFLFILHMWWRTVLLSQFYMVYQSTEGLNDLSRQGWIQVKCSSMVFNPPPLSCVLHVLWALRAYQLLCPGSLLSSTSEACCCFCSSLPHFPHPELQSFLPTPLFPFHYIGGVGRGQERGKRKEW